MKTLFAKFLVLFLLSVTFFVLTIVKSMWLIFPMPVLFIATAYYFKKFMDSDKEIYYEGAAVTKGKNCTERPPKENASKMYRVYKVKEKVYGQDAYVVHESLVNELKDNHYSDELAKKICDASMPIVYAYSDVERIIKTWEYLKSIGMEVSAFNPNDIELAIKKSKLMQ